MNSDTRTCSDIARTGALSKFKNYFAFSSDKIETLYNKIYYYYYNFDSKSKNVRIITNSCTRTSHSLILENPVRASEQPFSSPRYLFKISESENEGILSPFQLGQATVRIVSYPVRAVRVSLPAVQP